MSLICVLPGGSVPRRQGFGDVRFMAISPVLVPDTGRPVRRPGTLLPGINTSTPRREHVVWEELEGSLGMSISVNEAWGWEQNAAGSQTLAHAARDPTGQPRHQTWWPPPRGRREGLFFSSFPPKPTFILTFPLDLQPQSAGDERGRVCPFSLRASVSKGTGCPAWAPLGLQRHKPAPTQG